LEEIWSGLLRAFELIITLNPEVVDITARSLYISLASVFLSSLINIPVGAIIESREFWGKRGIISLIHTLYSLPTVTVGLLVYLILSRNGPLGSLEILYTPAGMILGQMILITPVMIGLTISALGEVSPQVKDTAKSLGASELQIMITAINEVRSAMLACVLLGFGRALSEVGVAMMIGGNIRGHTRVLTTAISLETSMGNLELSMALGIILLSTSLLVNLVMNRLQGRS